VIHCGVDPDAFQVADRATVGPLRIIAVGTLHEVKGQAHLIEACRRLAARGVDLTCRFIGDGPDREALTKQIDRAGLGDRVTLVGRMTSDAVAAELARSDVLAAPSVPTSGGKREGIPVVLMEAMAAGLPVVASRLSGIPELVTDGVSGLLVPPGDDDALADALERLAGDAALRARLGAAGRETVVREFDVDRNAAALASRIQATLAERPERHPSTSERATTTAGSPEPVT
jgi:colanic acid/amylovoran biosynthesis glycosyltransferase